MLKQKTGHKQLIGPAEEIPGELLLNSRLGYVQTSIPVEFIGRADHDHQRPWWMR